MSTDTFFAPKRQVRRILAWDLRILRGEACMASILTLLGFYAFHGVGQSRAYDVVLPFLLASIAMAYLTIAVCKAETRKDTGPFFWNLPVERTTVWNARVGVLMTTALLLEVLIGVGALLKLGGGGMTPCYRIPVDAAVLPFFATAAAMAWVYTPFATQWCFQALTSAAIIMCWLLYRVNHPGEATEANGYIHDPSIPLAGQIVVALTLAAAALGLIMWTRRAWFGFDLGEIQ